MLFGFLAMLGGLKRKSSNAIIDSEGRVKKIVSYHGKKKHLFGSLFMRFALDKYPLYTSSFLGQLWLVGNQILPANHYGRGIFDQLPDYKPGVLSYSEMLNSDINDSDYYNHEMYYLNHSTSGMDLGLIIKFLWRRFWK